MRVREPCHARPGHRARGPLGDWLSGAVAAGNRQGWNEQGLGDWCAAVVPAIRIPLALRRRLS